MNAMPQEAGRVPNINFPKTRLPDAKSAAWPLFALFAVILMQVELALNKSVNWDEFLHFSIVHQYLLGRQAPVFQVPFVYLFAWVPSLPGDNLDHIRVMRLLTLPFELVTVACIFAMARRFSSTAVGMVCALAYVTGGYVFLHAFALRADMIAAALLCVAMWLFLCRPLRLPEVAAIIVLLLLAFVSTIKAVLFAPAFLGIGLLRLRTRRKRLALAALILGGVTLGVLFLQLGSSLPDSGVAGFFRNLARFGNASVARMFSGDLFPQGNYFLIEIAYAPILAVLVCLASIAIVRSRRSNAERLALAGLLLPIATVVFYRNAFPYFFAFILPPVAVAIAPAVELVLRRYSLAALSLLLLANAACLSALEDRSVLRTQEAIQQGVREIFPQPVTYIDESGMIGDYPRAVAHFASGWGLEGYRAAGRLEYRDAVLAETTPMLIANSFSLMNLFFETDDPDELLPGDVAFLRDNYIRHWGLLFVAGKQITPQTDWVNVAVPGPYTVEGQPLTLDGRRYGAGEVIELDRGQHEVAPSQNGQTTLRWGDHLPRPSKPWPEGRAFTDY